MSSGTDTLEEIAELRRLRQPTEVRLHRVPTWLRRRIRERLKPESGMEGWKLLDFARERAGCHGLAIDHWGTTVLNGAEVFVSEPYLAPSYLAGIERFAELLGLNVEVSENSWWFPGNTTRLIFTLKKEPDEKPTDRGRSRGTLSVQSRR